MKKCYLIFVALMTCLNVFSETLSDNPEEIVPINYRFDYSLMTIDKWEAKGYIAAHENEANDTPDVAFDKFTQKLEIAFVSIVNGKSLVDKGYRLDNKSQTRYAVVICFLGVDKDGEHKVRGFIWDNTRKEYLTHFECHGDGGMWGTFNNLFYDSMSKSGKKFGNQLVSSLKKIKM